MSANFLKFLNQKKKFFLIVLIQSLNNQLKLLKLMV